MDSPRSVSRMRLCRPWLATLFVTLGCGTRPTPPAPAADGGPTLNLPTQSCPDAASLAPSGAGPCIVLKRRQFSREIVPLFDSCAGEICHSFADGQISAQVGIPAEECCGGLQMIEPGHPERSY